MTIIQRSDDARRLWMTLIPNVIAPDERGILLWCQRFSDAQIEKALFKIGRKFAGQTTDPASVHKYVTGLLLHYERESAKQSNPEPQKEAL